MGRDRAVERRLSRTETGMTQEYGAQGMVGRLRRVMVRRPDEAMAAADPARWHYAAPIDLAAARAAHDRLSRHPP